ncbi:MAG TPA: nucleolar RNA-binding Nop10p family protein [archaeon]|nr:nucleolar RNA-binding Nop10p family protein [archaeon]
MRLKKCVSCGRYTMKPACQCGSVTRSAHPPKYAEKFAKYRRMAKAK